MGSAVSMNKSSSSPELAHAPPKSELSSSHTDGKKEKTATDIKESKSAKDVLPPPSSSPAVEPRPRRMSLQDMMTPAAAILSPRQQSVINIMDTEQLTVGDIVKVTREGYKDAEGIVIEKISNTKLRVDFGERIADCLIADCVLIVHDYEFENGDKVEARPPGTNLFFVGKVIKIHPDKSMDILMDGDDLGDIERNITPDNCRKLMSRRSVVINRWKRAFMMVVAANFFKRISFARSGNEMAPLGAASKQLSATMYTHDEDEKYSV